MCMSMSYNNKHLFLEKRLYECRFTFTFSLIDKKDMLLQAHNEWKKNGSNLY